MQSTFSCWRLFQSQPWLQAYEASSLLDLGCAERRKNNQHHETIHYCPYIAFWQVRAPWLYGRRNAACAGGFFRRWGKGFSILSRYTKTCRENADKLSLLNHRCLHIYVLHKPSSIQVPRNTFQEAKWFLQTTACLHFHWEKEPSDQFKSEMTSVVVW